MSQREEAQPPGRGRGAQIWHADSKGSTGPDRANHRAVTPTHTFPVPAQGHNTLGYDDCNCADCLKLPMASPLEDDVRNSHVRMLRWRCG